MILTDNRGLLTVQFILATFISLSIIIMLFMLSITFVHISVTQYMSYSTARRLSLGDESKDKQIALAKAHYVNLRGQFFKPSAYHGPGQWFEISPSLQDGDLGFASGCPGASQRITGVSYPRNPQADRCLFYGVRIKFKSNVTDFRIPGLIDERTQNEMANVMSFLGREPSQEECKNFFRDKEQQLKSVWNPGSWGTSSTSNQEGDNGC